MIMLLDSKLFAAVVGGFIAIFSALVVEGWKRKMTRHERHRAWINGVSAEILHLEKVIEEIDSIIKTDISTKRLNHDFIEHSRLAVTEYESDKRFIELLTNVYRDIVHTNDMLQRLEHSKAHRPNVQNSVRGVRNSVLALKEALERKDKALKKPVLWRFWS